MLYWPENYWPTYYWPAMHWPAGFDFPSISIRTTRLLKSIWRVVLEDENGVQYDLGKQSIVSDSATFSIPPSVPDGAYTILVYSRGGLWKEDDLLAASQMSVTIDRTSSEAMLVNTPKPLNLRYEIDEGQLKLLWECAVPVGTSSGLVSAGIWLTQSVPDFNTDPDVTLPLFSFNSTHSYFVRVQESISYAGVALKFGEGNYGEGQYITVPDRSAVRPSFTATQG